MKKKIFVFAVALFAAVNCFSQTWDEWWHQKATQIKYLYQQIAALQIYLKDAEKGYQIVEDGLHTIGDIKNGEFNLHSIFFNSLKTVSPKVKNMAEIAEIVATQVSIVELFKKRMGSYNGAGSFSTGDLGYLGKVYSTVTDACSKDIDDLLTILTDDKVQATDDQRMRRIDAIHESMLAKYSATKSITGSADLLALQRASETADIHTLEALYGIN